MDPRRPGGESSPAPQGAQERLTRLANERLDRTRLASGKVALRTDWYLLDEVVESALERMQDLLRNRPVTLRLRPDFLLMEFDAVLIEQVLMNLLDNAAEYTPPGTPIDISVSRGDRVVEIEVADRGPGLSPEQAQRGLENFPSGGPETSGRSWSGLATCRAIVEAHGGKIRAENRPWGGTRVRFTLPVIDQPAGMPRDA